MNSITLRFAPGAHGYHTLEIVPSDGVRELVTLESKTFLLHDFIHYSVESIAGLKNSFWGTLSRGVTMADMGRRMDRDDPETMAKLMGEEAAQTEMVVGPLTGVMLGRATPAQVLRGIEELTKAQGTTVPSWLTEEFIFKVQEKMRHLLGHWNSLKKGEVMELVFEA